MWLLHSLLILFLISQLIIITHANLPVHPPDLWLPDHPDIDPYKEAYKSYQKKRLAISSASSSSQVPQTRAIKPDRHEVKISFFRERLEAKKLSTQQKIEFVGIYLNDILRQPSMSFHLKQAWYKEIVNQFDNYEEATIDHILYAFHTLLLQSPRNDFLSFLAQKYLNKFKLKISAQLYLNQLKLETRTPPILPAEGQWSQEIQYPERGLSQTFLDWHSIYKWLRCDLNLSKVARAKDQNEIEVITTHLEKLYQTTLFSASPKISLSAQSRVASIALLHHLLDMKRFPEITKKVKAIIKSLINDQEDKYFLFEHERTLIGNLDREQSAKPTKATTSS